MRAFLISVGLFVAAGAAFQLAGCGGDDTGGGGGGKGSTSGGEYPCSPENFPDCDVARDVKSDCIALFDYAGQDTTTLRIAQLTIDSPDALTSSLVKALVNSGVTLNLPDCFLGSDAETSTNGNFNWLLQFDKTNKKLKTGGAKPVADPRTGYTFENDTLTQNGTSFKVQPIELDITLDDAGNFSAAQGLDVTVPIYSDKAATSFVLLPLHNARITNGKLSSDNNCIGNFDAEHLTPDFSCTSDLPFITGANLDGFIVLEEADKVIVEQNNTTLCAILVQQPTLDACPRDNNGKIVDGGVADWCSDNTNGCKDSVKVTATFAASAVKLNQ